MVIGLVCRHSWQNRVDSRSRNIGFEFGETVNFTLIRKASEVGEEKTGEF